MSSKWGDGDDLTLELLEEADTGGKWLNLAAGDGRYMLELLSDAEQVIATDVSSEELEKLYSQLNPHQKEKVTTTVLDATERLPFKQNEFDGVLCTGFLNLIKTEERTFLANEIKRVLKPGGKAIMDFAAEVDRKKGPETSYSSKDARDFFQDNFGDMDLQMEEGRFRDVNAKNGIYSEGKFIVTKVG